MSAYDGSAYVEIGYWEFGYAEGDADPSIHGPKQHDADLAERVRAWHAIEDRQKAERLEKKRAQSEALEKTLPPPKAKKKRAHPTVVVLAMDPQAFKSAPKPKPAPTVLPANVRPAKARVEALAADELELLTVMLDDADMGPMDVVVLPATRKRPKKSGADLADDEIELLLTMLDEPKKRPAGAVFH